MLSELGAGLSSEHIILMAALRFPSSILAETALASKVAASGFLTVVWLTIMIEVGRLNGTFLDHRSPVVPFASSRRLD